MDELRALNSSPRQNQNTVNKPSAIDSVRGDKGQEKAAVTSDQAQSALVNRKSAVEAAYGVEPRGIEQRQNPAAEESISNEDKQEAVKKLNDYVQNVQRSLEFDFDEEAGKSVITVVDRSTKEVIRQIPDEIAVELARNLNEEESVSLFSTKA